MGLVASLLNDSSSYSSFYSPICYFDSPAKEFFGPVIAWRKEGKKEIIFYSLFAACRTEGQPA
jgi:hypothetical protein